VTIPRLFSLILQGLKQGLGILAVRLRTDEMIQSLYLLHFVYRGGIRVT
jgi:hypothetical protein